MSNRESKKLNTFITIAKQISELGTCCRLKVGCVLVREDWSVAGMGYNGAPSGMAHCNPEICNDNCRCVRTAHAEENAIFYSTGEIFRAFVTHQPCLVCTKMLARRGVKEIYYLHEYKSMPDHERDFRDTLLAHYNITMCKLSL